MVYRCCRWNITSIGERKDESSPIQTIKDAKTKRVGNIQDENNKKGGKGNDEITSSALEGDEEYGKEYDSSDKDLVVPKMIKRQDNYNKSCLC